MCCNFGSFQQPRSPRTHGLEPACFQLLKLSILSHTDRSLAVSDSLATAFWTICAPKKMMSFLYEQSKSYSIMQEQYTLELLW